MRELKGLGKELMAFVKMDVFSGQMTSEDKEVLQENNVLLTNVPANMTRFYQPLDLTVNPFMHNIVKWPGILFMFGHFTALCMKELMKVPKGLLRRN